MKMRRAARPRRPAMQEMVSDAQAGLFISDEEAREFIKWLTKESGKTVEEQRTVLQRIADFFDRLVKSISQYMKKLRFTTRQD